MISINSIDMEQLLVWQYETLYFSNVYKTIYIHSIKYTNHVNWYSKGTIAGYKVKINQINILQESSSPKSI
jgi:hypothetical protein